MYVTFQEKAWELLKNKIHDVTHQNVMPTDGFDYWFFFFADLKLYLLTFLFLIDDL